MSYTVLIKLGFAAASFSWLAAVSEASADLANGLIGSVEYGGDGGEVWLPCAEECGLDGRGDGLGEVGGHSSGLY